MSVIWSGLTEEGAIVPVQVDSTGRVIAIGKDEGLDYWEKEGGILRPTDGESVVVEGTISSSVGFSGPTASFSEDVTIHGLTVGLGGNSASSNTAVGLGALFNNTTGNENTAVGRDALFNNTEGIENTALGRSALSNNTEGLQNTSVGRSSLFNNTTGTGNTAVGRNALATNITGNNNTFIGQNPGINGLNDTVVISAGELERLWIDSEGQTGIGTNNPQAKLDVAGPVLFSDGLCGFLETGELFFTSRNSSWKLVVSSGGLVTAEELPSEFLRLNDRKQHVIPPFIETNIDDGLSGQSMDIDNSSLNRD